MRSDKALHLLNEGRIDELKQLLSDEIYAESLSNKPPGAKQRYAAMKKYFSYGGSAREILQKPCEVGYKGEKYISFCNSYSLALTKESCGEIAMCEDPSRYPDVTRIIGVYNNGYVREIDFLPVLAKAAAQGYKLKKSEFYSNKFLVKLNDAYFRLPLLDSTFKIIYDGQPVTVYHKEGMRAMVIKNDIGLCVIMPVRIENPEESIIIEVE